MTPSMALIAAEWWSLLLELDRLGIQPVQAAIEIILLALGIYAVLRFLRSTRGFGVLRGLALFVLVAVFGFTVLKETVQIPVLQEILQLIAPGLVLILVILFQPELRQGITRFGHTTFLRFFNFARDPEEEAAVAKVVVAAQRMAKERIGALIAFERSVSLAAYYENAVQLDAPISSILLETIFFPGNPLHDGAVVVRGDKILAAATLLPLTENPEVQRRMGTRHRAALGLTEETDSVTLVVSEETGQISLCSDGEIHLQIPFDQLEERLGELLRAERRRRRGPEAEPEATVAAAEDESAPVANEASLEHGPEPVEAAPQKEAAAS